MRMLPSWDVDDLAQDVFAKVALGLAHFEGRAKLSTWIYRIATNTAIDCLRKNRTGLPETPMANDIPAPGTDEMDIQDSIPREQPLQCLIDTQMNTCIREHVDKLPEIYRTAMILSAFEELSNKDIAQILDISLETVKIRLHRGRAMLRKILDKACSFYQNPQTGALSCDRKQH